MYKHLGASINRKVDNFSGDIHKQEGEQFLWTSFKYTGGQSLWNTGSTSSLGHCGWCCLLNPSLQNSLEKVVVAVMILEIRTLDPQLPSSSF